jgi:hypothetical protein
MQFVDSTIEGLLSWRAESDVLLAELREQVFFTQRKKVRVVCSDERQVALAVREGGRLHRGG